MDSDSDSDDTLTSSDCTDDESSADESDIEDDLSDCDAFSFTSFSVISDYSTHSTAKCVPRKVRNGPKKRVSFKPGDSLVLVYEIPNREMLGLKSASESSDDCYDDSDDDDDDEDEGDNDKGGIKTNHHVKDKKLPKLISVKQITKRNNCEVKMTKRSPERVSKLIGLKVNPPPPKQKKRTKRYTREERPEKKKSKVNFVCNGTAVESKKEKRQRRSRLRAIANKLDIDKTGKLKRKKSRLVEIKATVQARDTKQDTSAPTSRLTASRHGIRPSVATLDDHGAISVCGKPLTQRAKLQPTSFRLAKREVKHCIKTRHGAAVPVTPERQMTVRHCMSASYDSIRRLQVDAATMQRISCSAVGPRRPELDTAAALKRLDPDRMSATNKRNYAWQVANGEISSLTLRTPSIIPMWDNVHGGVAECNNIKLPT